LAISNHNSFRVLFDKIASVYFIRKCINILAWEMASPGNRHCASCIGTLLFSIHPQFLTLVSSSGKHLCGKLTGYRSRIKLSACARQQQQPASYIAIRGASIVTELLFQRINKCNSNIHHHCTWHSRIYSSVQHNVQYVQA